MSTRVDWLPELMATSKAVWEDEREAVPWSPSCVDTNGTYRYQYGDVPLIISGVAYV